MQNEPNPLPAGASPQPPAHPPLKGFININKILTTIAILAAIAALGLTFWHFHQSKAKPQSTSTNNAALHAVDLVPKNIPSVLSKNYGNKYASGVLPVGDGKYVTDAPKTGYIYVCSSYAHNLQTQAGGAGKRGPWFSADGTTYNLNQKLHVQGSVSWTPSFTDTVNGVTRTIFTNDLPNHPTGTFPIVASDPAYAYDKNPNTITAQSLTFALTTGPVFSATPNCMGGQSGVMLDGVVLFNGFDAAGRDAGAWEVQDSCDGHPESQGEYHYHTLSSCIKDISVKTVIGFGLDGFPITGPQAGAGNIMTTSDLDECHGITSPIVLDGKTVNMYHYVMTQDFPYSVSCFRGTPITPPGMQAGPTQHP